MFKIHITAAAAAFAIAAVLAIAAVPTASAKGGHGVRVSGVCTQGSSAKLKLSREDGRIEVEFEVDQNRNGVPWKVALRRNGTLVASTTARTHGPSGSFSVRRLIAAHGLDGPRQRESGPILGRALHGTGRSLSSSLGGRSVSPPGRPPLKEASCRDSNDQRGGCTESRAAGVHRRARP